MCLCLLVGDLPAHLDEWLVAFVAELLEYSLDLFRSLSFYLESFYCHRYPADHGDSPWNGIRALHSPRNRSRISRAHRVLYPYPRNISPHIFRTHCTTLQKERKKHRTDQSRQLPASGHFEEHSRWVAENIPYRNRLVDGLEHLMLSILDNSTRAKPEQITEYTWTVRTGSKSSSSWGEELYGCTYKHTCSKQGKIHDIPI
jgi:hypothetical protein